MHCFSDSFHLGCYKISNIIPCAMYALGPCCLVCTSLIISHVDHLLCAY